MEMEQKKCISAELWLSQATAGIPFQPDRRAVRAELETHLEDKALDFQRIFPDLSQEEAKERAAAEMGDPVEIGTALSKIHRPWLGWLWRVSQVLLALLTALFLVWLISLETSMDNPLWGGYPEDFLPPENCAPDRISLGGYTFRIVEAVYQDYPESSPYLDGIRVTFQVSSPRVWAMVNTRAVMDGLTLVGADGQRWPMENQVVDVGQAGTVSPQTDFRLYSWGLFHRTFQASIFVEEPEWDRISLEFSFPLGEFTLSSDLTREEVSP